MSSKTETASGWTALLVLTFGSAALLRVVGLQSGMWYDEIATLVLSARQPLHQILTEFHGVNSHPLYSVLAHLSISTFGEAVWSLRLPACIFGIASVIMVYVLGTQSLARIEAWAAAAVLAVSYHHIWFSQNARGYTLIGFLTLVSTYLLLRIRDMGHRNQYWMYAIVCAAGVYTHLTMAFVVVGQAIAVMSARNGGVPRERLRPLMWAWLGAGLCDVVAYAPFLRGLLGVATRDGTQRTVQVATASWALAEAVRSALAGAGVAAAIVATGFAVIGTVVLWRRQPFVFWLLIAPAIVTAVALLTVGQPIRPRFFFFLSGAAALFVGAGLGYVADLMARPREMAVIAGTLLLVAISATALPLNYRVPKQDFDGAVQFLDAAEVEGARIAASGPACLPLEIYYTKTWRCLKTLTDWQLLGEEANRAPVFIVYTLAEYIDDPQLQVTLRSNCPIVRQFRGTLGGGDITVCRRPALREVARR